MCGFGIDTIFRVAIFIVVVLVLIAMVRWAFGSWFVNVASTSYWGLIQIVIVGVVSVIILLVLWKLAECAGLVRMGGLSLGSLFDAV